MVMGPINVSSFIDITARQPQVNSVLAVPAADARFPVEVAAAVVFPGKSSSPLQSFFAFDYAIHQTVTPDPRRHHRRHDFQRTVSAQHTRHTVQNRCPAGIYSVCFRQTDAQIRRQTIPVARIRSQRSWLTAATVGTGRSSARQNAIGVRKH